MKLDKYIPLIEQLRGYDSQIFRSDFFAGITVAVMLIPQGMAYAYLAGLPPIYGLYGGLVPLLIYALLGTSRQLSIGPVAVSAILVAAGVGQLAESGSPEYISLVIVLGFYIGIAQIILGLFRMGFFVNFLSHPVIAGFTSAAAIIIAITQLKDALGIAIPRFDKPLDTFLYALSHISETQWVPLLMCFGSVAIILILKKINRSIPGALIVVIIGTLLAKFLGLDENGLEVVREIPQGLPDFLLPDINMTTFRDLIPTIFTVTIIGLVECLGIAKVLEAKHRNYSINADQEMKALGISKLLGSLFQALPTSGSFSRSAVNSNSGAQTNVASLITVTVIALALFALTPLFYYLPKSVLAAIILLAVTGLFDYKEAINLWKTHKSDLTMMLVTFLTTLTFGIDLGVLFGVILSILVVLYRSTKPHMALLGNIPGTQHYRNVERYDKTSEFKNALIIRFDDQLYFGNCNYFKDKVNQFISDSSEVIEHILIDAANIHAIDSSGIHILKDLDRHLKLSGISLYLCSATGPVRDMLTKSNLMNEPDKHHLNISDAVEFIKEKQSNIELDNMHAISAMQSSVSKKK